MHSISHLRTTKNKTTNLQHKDAEIGKQKNTKTKKNCDTSQLKNKHNVHVIKTHHNKVITLGQLKKLLPEQELIVKNSTFKKKSSVEVHFTKTEVQNILSSLNKIEKRDIDKANSTLYFDIDKFKITELQVLQKLFPYHLIDKKYNVNFNITRNTVYISHTKDTTENKLQELINKLQEKYTDFTIVLKSKLAQNTTEGRDTPSIITVQEKVVENELSEQDLQLPRYSPTNSVFSHHTRQHPTSSVHVVENELSEQDLQLPRYSPTNSVFSHHIRQRPTSSVHVIEYISPVKEKVSHYTECKPYYPLRNEMYNRYSNNHYTEAQSSCRNSSANPLSHNRTKPPKDTLVEIIEYNHPYPKKKSFCISEDYYHSNNKNDGLCTSHIDLSHQRPVQHNHFSAHDMGYYTPACEEIILNNAHLNYPLSKHRTHCHRNPDILLSQHITRQRPTWYNRNLQYIPIDKRDVISLHNDYTKFRPSKKTTYLDVCDLDHVLFRNKLYTKTTNLQNINEKTQPVFHKDLNKITNTEYKRYAIYGEQAFTQTTQKTLNETEFLDEQTCRTML